MAKARTRTSTVGKTAKSKPGQTGWVYPNRTLGGAGHHGDGLHPGFSNDFVWGFGTELKASARQLAAGLRRARSEAISRRHETVMTVDVEGRQFQLSGDQRVYRLPKSVAVQLFTAQSELRNGSVGAIRFFPDGGSTGGRITVTSLQRKYEVDINWLTGQVAILD